MLPHETNDTSLARHRAPRLGFGSLPAHSPLNLEGSSQTALIKFTVSVHTDSHKYSLVKLYIAGSAGVRGT